MQLPFSSYQRSPPNAVTRLVNVFAEQNPISGMGPISLFRHPGIRAYQNVGTGPGRGLHVMNGKLHAVSGIKLYRVDASAIELGTIPGTGRVSMANNGIHLVVVTNPDAYALTAMVVSQITDADFTSRGASRVDFVDGYFVFTEPNSGRFFSSDLYSLAFDPLKFATAEGSPDNLVDLIVNHRQITLMGKQSGETWWNSGADNFPFERLSGGFYEIGIIGGLAKLDNTEFCFANDKTVRRLMGNIWQRVSTHGVEEKLRTYTSIPYGFTFKSEGHEFYVLKFTEATWVYDATTQEWTERQTYPATTWRVNDCVELDGLYYVQDATTGKVGIIDPTVYDEWGDTLRAEWTYPPVYDQGRTIFHNRLDIIVKTGVGLITGQGSVPEIMLEFSDDGGLTWISAPTRGLGAIGKYMHRVFWTSLGSSNERVYRCSVSDPVQVIVMDTVLDAEPGEI